MNMTRRMLLTGTAAIALMGAAFAGEAAAQSSKTMLARMQKAYDLGDQGLTELLIARRQYYDVRRAETQARGAAHDAVLQLLIDSHRIWGLSDEG